MPGEDDWKGLIDLSQDAFTDYLSVGEARALHEFLANMNPRYAALFCTTATEALLAISAVQKLQDWLLRQALNKMGQRASAGEIPEEE